MALRTTIYYMKKNIFVLLSVAAIILSSMIFWACKEDDEIPGPGQINPAVIEGVVLGKFGSQEPVPLQGAVVSVQNSIYEADTLSNALGKFRFVVTFPDSALRATSTTLSISKFGFNTQTVNFEVRPGSNVNANYILIATDTTTPKPPSGFAAALVFVGATGAFSNVKGVGGIESTSFTFEARDSAGYPVDSLHRATIAFRLIPAISGGEQLLPETTKTEVLTGKVGRATATLYSGKKAGIVQIEASVVGYPDIRATSSAFPIYSGPPESSHFTVAIEKRNFPALNLLGVQNKVTVQVGDKWGNPVPAGNPLYFSTTAGIIQASSNTNDLGIAEATLTSGNPQPSNGLGWVTASTVGDSGKTIMDSIRVLFSGQPRVTGNDNLYQVSDGGVVTIPFRVFDQLRNPLSAGTRIQVSFTGDATSDMAFSGDLDVTMPDVQDTSFTFFSVTARDTLLQAPTNDKGFVMSVSVTGPNGSTIKSFAGVLLGTGGIVFEEGKPASIILSGISTNQISVHGTGQNETAILTFLVRDRSGRPVPQDSTLVYFDLVGPSGGATLGPLSVRTDNQGRVQTALTSGTVAGVVQIIASIDTGGLSRLSSSPVPITIAGGLPDNNHFTLAVQKLNIPAWYHAGVTDGMTVYVGDEYGNPVQPNTAIYFTTTGGLIDPSAYTNTSGIANTELRSGFPNPPQGIATITASTIDRIGTRISKEALVCFSGSPIITVSQPYLTIADDSAVTLWFGVHDLNHNPLSAGTTVNVSLAGRDAGELLLNGDVSTTLRDALYGGFRIDTFAVTIIDTVANSLRGGTFSLTISVDGPNGGSSTILGGTLLPTRNPRINSIALLTPVPRELSITDAGGIDTATIAFQIRDGLDQPIRRAGERISFDFVGRQGHFTPPSANTDANGIVQTVFHTGRYVDTIKMKAIVDAVSPIYSVEKTIFIQPGAPTSGNSHMTICLPDSTTPKVNFAVQTSTSVQVGTIRFYVKDRFDNPVLPNTEILFTTNAGEIRGASFTEAGGLATVKWYGGSVVPADGNVNFKAYWNNGSTNVLLDSVSVTYSGSPQISGGLVSNTTLPAGIDRGYSFTVSDIRGNPLTETTKVIVTKFGSAAGSVTISGDTLVSIPDTRDTANTRFTFHILDTNTVNSNDRTLGIRIFVSGRNGNAQKEVTNVIKGVIPPPSNTKLLALVGITPTRISVTGTGGVDRTTLTYEMQDSNYAPVRRSGVTVTFDYNGQQGGFDPPYDTTDADGRIKTIFISGTAAETVRVFGQMGRVISTKQDIIVLPGAPSRSYFDFSLLRPGDTLNSKVNFPGNLPSNKRIGEARVRLGDRYGNPVGNNTKVAFRTDAGVIVDTAYSRNGSVRVDWLGGDPFPPSGGLAHVVATVVGQGGQIIGDSAEVVYSGIPRITDGLPDNFELRQGIDTTITYTIADDNGNPIAEGSTVSVTAGGSAANSLVVTGNLNFTTIDTKEQSATSFQLTIRDTNTTNVNDRPLTLVVQILGPNGNVSKTMTALLKGIIPPPIPSIAGLRLESVGANVLTVKNGGGIESSLLTYQVLDSIGNPIAVSGKEIVFHGIGVGHTFSPETAYTDANGQARALLHTDTIAGIVQVTATAMNGAVQSSPTNIVIVGGRPSQNYFTFILTRSESGIQNVNYPGGMPLVQKIGTAKIQAGDRYGNPVPAGTPIYFNTNAGIIQGSAFTDANGFAQVDWFGGNPLPAGGAAIVKASAAGENDIVVKDSAVVTYSGQILIGDGPSPNFSILGAGSMTFSFLVRDINGNPPAEGTHIQVSTTGSGARAVVLSGDVDVTMPDTRDSAASRFSVIVRDTTTLSTVTRSLAINISVTGPNGSAQQLTSGSLLATGGGRTRLPGSIALISTSASEIQVIGTGGIETSSMIFEIRDSLGVPVDSSYKVKFSITPPLGNAFISPDSGFSDAQTGRITSVIHSGTTSGTIQVNATIDIGGGTIFMTTPVRVIIHSGQPDQEHLSIGAKRLNVPGLDINGIIDSISILLGDKYGNPVPESTAVYFSSTLGVVTTNTGFTDQNGMASVALFSGNPRPAGGFGYVKASTVGQGGVVVSDSVRILFSGQSIIDSLRFEPSEVTDFVLYFKVYDRNNNPLANGNEVTATFDGDVSLSVSRVFPQSRMPDTQDPFWTEYSAVYSIKRGDNPLKLGTFTGSISVTGPNGTAVKTFQGIVDTIARPTATVYGVRLISSSNQVITVKDGGGVQSTLLSYEVLDSLQHAIKRAGIEVVFQSEGVPGSFTPETTITDIYGQVRTTFRSETQAGNVRVRAYVGSSVSSPPYTIAVVGGKPSQQHFSVVVTPWFASPKSIGSYTQMLNVAGEVLPTQTIGQIRAQLGDKYGNPVPPKTIVYFTTNAGIVVGTDTTNDFGLAVADWMGGNPFPSGGAAILKASALGDNNNLVVDSQFVTYSGAPIITNGLPDGFVLPFGFDTTITYRVRDHNGNPLASGNNINVSLSGDGASFVSMTGDRVVTMSDTRDTNATIFTLRLRDLRTSGNIAMNLSMKINTSGPNGFLESNVNGLMGATGATGRTHLPGSIALISASDNEIQVSGTGGIETSTLIFEVRDSLGVPVDSTYQINFAVQPSLGGAFISPSSGFNNAQTGRISCVVHAGTASGAIQVVASLGSGITSSPVRIIIDAGQPDQAHFSIGATPHNIAGLHINGNTSFIGVIVGDKYGNPVHAGTGIYFTTSIGVVTTSSGFTNSIGQAQATLYSGNPRSADGFGYVTASTVGDSGVVVKDSTRMLFSGSPIIDSINFVPSDTTNFVAYFRVYDENENPLAGGTTVNVAIDGDVSLKVSQVFPASNIPDTQDPFWTKFAVQFSMNTTDNPIRTGPFTATITVSGPNGTGVRSFVGHVDFPPTPPTPPLVVKGIKVLTVSTSQLTVKDAGGTETSLITFQLLDSTGSAISLSGVAVDFTSSGASGTLNPTQTITNASGQASALFSSDSVTGIAKIVAHVTGGGFDSDTASITISGGKASQDHLTLILARPGASIQKMNFPGASPAIQTIGQALVQVGDRYGNPVPANTPVFFTSNAGVIEAQTTTNANGFAQVNWYGGNPIPSGGVAVVTVSTRGETGSFISTSDTVTYSGTPVVTGGLSTGFTLHNAIDTTINYTVADVNGNPLAEGSTIKVLISGAGASNLSLTGDVDITMPDTRDSSDANFSFHLLDNNTTITTVRSLTVTFQIGGSNGTVTKSAVGTLEGTAGAPPPNPPSVYGLRFLSTTGSNLTVKDAGGTEIATIAFEIIDSVGNAIPRSAVPIYFTRTGAPGKFSPDTSYTDVNGKVQVSFHSDTVAGVTNIFANASSTVRSGPVQIVIVGGQPNQQRFTMVLSSPSTSTRTVNYPGAMPLVQQIGKAQVQLGDRYGNPVPAGIAVSFSTNAGVIQGIGFTNSNGFATVNWFSGNPLPTGGVAVVTATTLGDNGQFSVSDTVTYSGQVSISGGPQTGFQIASGIVQTYTYSVLDTNGNPPAEGTTIRVTASGAASTTVVLSGDINVNVPDTRNPASTQLTFTVKDTSASAKTIRALQLAINVDGPNGTTSITRNGSVLPTGSADTTRSRLPGSIAFISISNTEIQVIGSGGTETSTMTFEVQDSLGLPVDSAYGVQFIFTASPGGGEFISPSLGYVDSATGRISAIVHSGTKSGVMQLKARVITPTDTISSEVVRLIIHGGLPDQAHFSIGINPLNIPGYVYNGRTSIATAIIGDKYGNPVPANTAVYFTSDEGVMSTNSGFTNSNGFASDTLFSGNPRSADGFGFVKAYTVGQNGTVVSDSARILFSGTPIITYTGPSSFTIPQGGSTSFTFTVADANGNPISPGSKISIEAITESDVGLTGTVTQGDTQISGAGSTIFTFTVTDIVEDTPVGGAISVKAKVVWEGLSFELQLATGTIN